MTMSNEERIARLKADTNTWRRRPTWKVYALT